jgi:hypothetical protein
VTDYETKSNVFFMNAGWTPSERFKLFLEGVVTMSEASFDPFALPEPEEAPGNGDYDYSMVNTYSDLDYTQVEATLGGNYAIGEKTHVYGSVTLMDLQDDEEYVYGDLSGTLTMYATGLTVGF